MEEGHAVFGQDMPVIGCIMMGGSAGLETELHRRLPPGVQMATTRVPFHQASYQGLLEMIGHLPDAARILAEARPNVIAVTSFTGSCIRGHEIVNVIEQCTGVPTVVPALEYAALLRELGAARVALATAFRSELRILEQLFFQEQGIQVEPVIQLDSPPEADPFSFGRVDYDALTALLRQTDLGGADALLVDLPAFTMNPQVQDALSRWPGLPVLSMIEALLWAACRHIGVPRDQLSLPRLLTP